MNADEIVGEVACLLKRADAVAIFAGAGMGVDSGLEQYRGEDGLWTKSLEVNGVEIDYYDLMKPAAFKEKPELAWGLIGSRMNQYDRMPPHIGFSVLKELVNQKEHFIVTSNIDEHFQKAGFNSERIFEFHGSIYNTQCMYHLECEVWKTPYIKLEPDGITSYPPFPVCPVCNSDCRPNIHLFDDDLFSPFISAEQQFRYMDWREYISVECCSIVALEIGAGETLPTIRRYAERFAGVDYPLIRINPKDSNTSLPNHISIPLNAQESLLRIQDYIDKC